MTGTRAMTFLRVKKLSEYASIPKRGSPLSAGFDLASAEKTVIKAGCRGIVKTDLSVACPPGTYARIAPRSGLAVKKFIDVGAGVVDQDYRGPVGVVLFNFGAEDFHVDIGDRVAQLVLEKISMVDAVEVSELDETERGEGGFGSTGVSSNAGPASKKQRAISPTEDSSTYENEVTGYLSLMLEIDEICHASEDFRIAVKKLALERDSRLVAAFASYRNSKNAKDLIETLKVILDGDKS